MTRLLVWLGVALLAAASTLAHRIYGDDGGNAWPYLAAAGTLFMVAIPVPRPRLWPTVICAALLLPAGFLVEAPLGLGFGIAVLGLGLLVPAARATASDAEPSTAVSILARFASGLVVSGGLWVLFFLITFLYEAFTARMPVLPSVLVDLLAFFMNLVGNDVVADSGELVQFSMRQKHPLAATWTLFADPASVCLFAGGLSVLLLSATQKLRATLAFTGAFGLWLVLRVTVLSSIYMHRTLRTGYDDEFQFIGMLWDPRWLLPLLIPAALMAACLFAMRSMAATPTEPAAENAPATPSLGRVALAGGLTFAALLSFTIGVLYHPSGARKSGRVIIDEYHCRLDDQTKARWPQKEFDTTSTLRPYDRDWFGEVSGYNYGTLYETLSRYYDVSHNLRPLAEQALSDCDVLVLKVPSKEYAPEEIDAVESFVKRGGSLLLIGEHTTVYGSGRNLNMIARKLGFEFRYDSVFGMNNVFQQAYIPPAVPHPAIQHLGPMNFAVSCSIDPGSSRGTAVVRGRALKNLGSDYSASNFYPPANDQPEMIQGSFVQVWATEAYGGRVLAFTDSTIFANFGICEPGKKELALGMIEWLNHEPGGGTSWLLVLGLLLTGGAVFVSVWPATREFPLLVLPGAATAGWLVAVLIVPGLHNSEVPERKPHRPTYDICFERSLSPTTDLSIAGFVPGKADGFILFERAVQRVTTPHTRRDPGRTVMTFRAPLKPWSQDDYLRWDTKRKNPKDPPHWRVLGTTKKEWDDSQLVISANPVVPPSEDDVDRITEYVEKGGKLLVLDSPSNKKSSANKLLAKLGMTLEHSENVKGDAQVKAPFQPIPIPEAVTVTGGEAFVHVNNKPVAARKKHGKGEVIVIGFGSRFADTNMGVTAVVAPDESVKKVYAWELTLLDAIIDDKWPTE